MVKDSSPWSLGLQVFLQTLTSLSLLLLQVSYVSVSTRETYSKVGRELLAAIATAHPYVISVLLERLRETIQTVGMVGIAVLSRLKGVLCNFFFCN